MLLKFYTMRFLISVLFILIISCNSKPKKAVTEAIEIYPTSIEINISYVELNIIVDHSNRIYYHIYNPKQFRTTCGYNGLNSEYPEYIHLKPNTLIETSIEELHALALKHCNNNKTCFIGIHKSKKDIFKKMKAEFRGIEGMVIRKRDLTEEEQVVLAYKTTQSKYNPWTVKWLNPNLMRHLGFEPILKKTTYPVNNQSAH